MLYDRSPMLYYYTLICLMWPKSLRDLEFEETCVSTVASGYLTHLGDGTLNIETPVALVVRRMAMPDSGLEIRDRLWLKINIPNAFIGNLPVILLPLTIITVSCITSLLNVYRVGVGWLVISECTGFYRSTRFQEICCQYAEDWLHSTHNK